MWRFWSVNHKVKLVTINICSDWSFVLSHSPFALVEDTATNMATNMASVVPPKDDEGLTLLNQVVHPDCRPVLEFGLVCWTPLHLCCNVEVCFLLIYIEVRNRVEISGQDCVGQVSGGELCFPPTFWHISSTVMFLVYALLLLISVDRTRPWTTSCAKAVTSNVSVSTALGVEGGGFCHNYLVVQRLSH